MSEIKELKTIIMNKKLRETTYLCVEIMNSKRQVHCKGETWSRGANLRLPFDVTWCLTSLIDLFSLYVLFSQYRSSDNSLENCFFQISSCSRAYVRTKRQSVKFPWDLCVREYKTYKLKRSIPRNPVQHENPGVLNKCLNGEAPPLGPTPYPLYTILIAVNVLSFK